MKKSLACVLLSAMVAFGSFAAGCGGSSEQAEKKTFTIAYAPNESTEQSTDARSSLAKDLGKVINMEVKDSGKRLHRYYRSAAYRQGRYGLPRRAVRCHGG